MNAPMGRGNATMLDLIAPTDDHSTCAECGGSIERHTAPGWSKGWYHVPAQTETMKPHAARPCRAWFRRDREAQR